MTRKELFDIYGEEIWHVNKGDNFNATLKTCTFADGTPFGIKEE